MLRRAIISVSNKTGIKEFAQGLTDLGWEIISTGGTARYLKENGVKVTPVSDVTKFPEIMDGRVKTLHPAILAGILADQSNPAHVGQLEQLGINPIDLVVVNLYPFEKMVGAGLASAPINRAEVNPAPTDDAHAVELIDIGGPTMLRAAAKNFHSVAVVVDPNDYASVLEELKKGEVSLETKKRLATKVFAHTAKYDGAIANYFSKGKYLNLNFEKISDLRYGENPHQKAAFYKDYGHSGVSEASDRIPGGSHRPSASRMTIGASIVDAEILQGGVVKLSSTTPQGKELSFNNILDADAALNLIQEFDEPAAVVIKHNNPCGVAICHPEPVEGGITTAFQRAWNADPLSAFGGIVALNRPCTREIAETLTKVFIEIVLAPDFTPESLEIFKSKPNVRLLKLTIHNSHSRPDREPRNKQKNFKQVSGGLLVQDKDESVVTEKDLNVVTKKHPSPEEVRDMLFAWKVVKHCKSNAIVLACDGVTLGLGLGQTSRVGSVKIAIQQAQPVMLSLTKHDKHLVCASDAFFPFRDSVDELAKAGVTAIIQPGGSKNDGEVIAAADTYNISMAFTSIRVFRH